MRRLTAQILRPTAYSPMNSGNGMRDRFSVAALGAALAVLALPGATLATEPIWALKGGGHVILMHHAITTPGVGDPPGMRLDDCTTQRNLTDEGRRHARQIGEAFRARSIVVDRVLASPWCRCVETARLAFGASEVWLPLSNLYGRSENRNRQRYAGGGGGATPGR